MCKHVNNYLSELKFCSVLAHFEGSLGRLTTASVHNPRHIIDVTRSASPTEDPSKKSVSKELRKFRQLLMDIEKVKENYSLLPETYLILHSSDV